MTEQQPETQLIYAVVIEPTATGYSAFVPDLPGCVGTGRTVAKVTHNIEGAVAMHLAAMAEDGEPIPTAGEVRSATKC